MRVFSPGQELHNGVTQELQPLVVIDPGEEGGGLAESDQSGPAAQDLPGGRGVVLSQAGHDVDQSVDA